MNVVTLKKLSAPSTVDIFSLHIPKMLLYPISTKMLASPFMHLSTKTKKRNHWDKNIFGFDSLHQKDRQKTTVNHGSQSPGCKLEPVQYRTPVP